ncbi:MAG TPA: DUF4389 domain-containing protein [Solirubrobacterales bacterium]|nr:DUF4389 domain-containing protein [Solirubrobacterales bacterium]
MNDRAVRLTVLDPSLERNRWTVGFRLILAIPHFIWLAGWFSLAVLVSIAQWIATLIQGTPSPMLHRFLAAYVRYAAHVAAYLTLAADPYPGFTGRPGSYPVEVEIPEPGQQNRWVTGFRLVLAIPAVFLADALLGFGSSAAGGGYGSSGVAATAGFLGWFYCLAHGRMAEGLRNAAVYGIGYSVQAYGYLFFFTQRYPNSDPASYEFANVYRADPIRVTVDDDLRRSRLTTFFRVLLAVPHFVWLLLWGIVALFAALANGVVTVIRGTSPQGLHNFLARYVRYQIHVYAYLQMVANPFPGFTGREGTYPVDVEIEGPQPQNRWVTFFRLILAIPAFLFLGALATAAFLAAVFSWFCALFTGRVPRGLRNLGAYDLRYAAQTYGYVYLLTDRYPYSGPAAGWQMTLAPEAPPPPAAPWQQAT